MSSRLGNDGLIWASADDVLSLGFDTAIRALQAALLSRDPTPAKPRSAVDVRSGQLLLMPAELSSYVGVKVVSVAPANPQHGQARIQGLYLLMDGTSLAPLAAMDGAALTMLRTPALSMAVLDRVMSHSINRVVVFGYGPQAQGHVDALLAIRHVSEIVIVARDENAAVEFARSITAKHPDIRGRVGEPTEVQAADLIVCATTSRTPLFDGRTVPVHASVVAVGSHEPDARELDSDLLRRSQVIVEDVQTAIRDAGDITMAIRDGALAEGDLVLASDISRGRAEGSPHRPKIFKSVGMSWQDLVVAIAIYQRLKRPADLLT